VRTQDWQALIFDLDGTLIDSAAGVLGSLHFAFSSCGVTPVGRLDPTIIGPPLPEMVRDLAGTADPAILHQLIETFRQDYDEVGCLRSTPFPGGQALLELAKQRGIPTHLVTNKRQSPTLRILDHLGWRPLLGQVYCPDTFEEADAPRTKTALLRHLCQTISLSPARCLYVGDRVEDQLAAQENGLTFCWAAWGGWRDLDGTDGETPSVAAPFFLTNPAEIARLFEVPLTTF
jgi:phosphoglycolate phosphatase